MIILVLFSLVACSNEEIVSLEEYEGLKEINNELREEISNLEKMVEEKTNIKYTTAGIDILEFEKPEDADDYYYAEMSEEEFMYRMNNTIEYLEEDFDYYFSQYKELEDTHLDTINGEFKSSEDYEIVHKKSKLLYFELDEKCATLFLNDTLATTLGDSSFMSSVSSSCNSLADGFRYLDKYDTNSNSTEFFIDSSQKNYERAYRYYEEELE